eukprot:TRINITY_DN3006_c0_g1_i4.p1 TRINITY_DN3006_c0_g1~~TRINITY_DN3006_c0_g1_i4.p1  ORF type:complete len:390 (-),score=68.76 TRINITY_DN3006_c0_g1_i4:303-1472(-)
MAQQHGVGGGSVVDWAALPARALRCVFRRLSDAQCTRCRLVSRAFCLAADRVSARGVTLKALAHWEAGTYDKANACLLRALRRDPKFTPALLALRGLYRWMPALNDHHCDCLVATIDSSTRDQRACWALAHRGFVQGLCTQPLAQQTATAVYITGYWKSLIEEDHVAAVALFEQAASANHAGAFFNLAWCVSRGLGTGSPDPVRAVQLYEQAAAGGHAASMFNLANSLWDGTGTQPNRKRAMQLYRRVAEWGNLEATFNLACCYDTGDGTEKDVGRAAELFAVGAAQGHAESIFNLACCYSEGSGVERDITKAAALYRRGTEEGHAGCMWGLAQCFYDGFGVPMDRGEAVRLYKLAADRGHSDAMCTRSYSALCVRIRQNANQLPPQRR